MRDGAQEVRISCALLDRTAQGFAINRRAFQRLRLAEHAGRPPADRTFEGRRIKPLEDAMKGRLTGSDLAFDAESPQPLRAVVGPPFGNRAFAARAAQYGHTSQ